MMTLTTHRCGVLTVAALAFSLSAAGCSGSGGEPKPAPEPSTAVVEDSPTEPSIEAPGSPAPGVQEDPTDQGSEVGPPRTPVPAEVVGEWDGDRFDYTFTPDGYVKITRIGEGTVEVAGDRMTFHIPGVSPWTATWRVTPCDDPAGFGYPFRSLYLDDYSYVQDC
jgi:hypothetical protein